MRLEIETPSPNSIEIIAACSQLNSLAASICSVANLFTQLNCDPTDSKTRLYKTIPYANNAIQAPAMPHQLCSRTSYASTCTTTSCYDAPIMQSTCYAKHLLCEAPAASFPPMSRSLLETPTECSDAKFIEI